MRRMLIAATALISLAALMSGAGLALASSGAGTGHKASSPDIWRAEHFRIIGTSGTSDKQSVVATGAFTAGGVEILGATHDKAYLYHGTFRIIRHITHRSAPVPPRNCVFTETERGSYTIGHGTGRYAGLHGTGRFSLRLIGVLAHTGKSCGRMVAFQQIMYESGHVNR